MSVTGVMDRPPGYQSPAAFFYPPFTGQAYQASVQPGNLSFITVTGTFLSLSGVAASGSVTFTPSGAPLKDAALFEFTGGPVTAALSGAGTISVRLLCTGNNDLIPFVWSYTITPTINGVSSSFPGKNLPYSPSSTIDLSALLP